MNITMTPQVAKTLFEDFNHDELQSIKDETCEGCKGDNIRFWDSDCRFYCKGFIDTALEYIREPLVINMQSRPDPKDARSCKP